MSDLFAKLCALLDQIVCSHVPQFFSFHVALSVPQTSSEWTACAPPSGTPLEQAVRRRLPFRTISAPAEPLQPTSLEHPFPCPFEFPLASWLTACLEKFGSKPYHHA